MYELEQELAFEFLSLSFEFGIALEFDVECQVRVLPLIRENGLTHAVWTRQRS